MTVNRSRWIQFVTLAAIWFVVRVYFVVPHGTWPQRTTILGTHLAGALLFQVGSLAPKYGSRIGGTAGRPIHDQVHPGMVESLKIDLTN